jgi:hypothetical protein
MGTLATGLRRIQKVEYRVFFSLHEDQTVGGLTNCIVGDRTTAEGASCVLFPKQVEIVLEIGPNF